ncbi:hypothetical protein Trydic_g10026 [Trypoxylus dichotomus]
MKLLEMGDTMAGAVFIINVPTEAYEKELDKKCQKSISPTSTSSSTKQHYASSVDEKPLLSAKNSSKDYSSIAGLDNVKKCNCLYMQKVFVFVG